MVEVLAPDLGQSGMDVKIEVWRNKEGDSITKGEILFEISNEKLTQDIEAPATGILKKIHVQEGEEVGVGVLIAEIE